jgi:hypothetical protein
LSITLLVLHAIHYNFRPTNMHGILALFLCIVTTLQSLSCSTYAWHYMIPDGLVLHGCLWNMNWSLSSIITPEVGAHTLVTAWQFGSDDVQLLNHACAMLLRSIALIPGRYTRRDQTPAAVA